jgi:hypothetical protein
MSSFFVRLKVCAISKVQVVFLWWIVVLNCTI